MKQRQKRKLALHKETLRNLDGMAMSRVVGGVRVGGGGGGGGGEQSTTSGQVCCSFPSEDCPTQDFACEQSYYEPWMCAVTSKSWGC